MKKEEVNIEDCLCRNGSIHVSSERVGSRIVDVCSLPELEGCRCKYFQYIKVEGQGVNACQYEVYHYGLDLADGQGKVFLWNKS